MQNAQIWAARILIRSESASAQNGGYFALRSPTLTSMRHVP